MIDRQNKKILLGWKKRGFGAFKYNGFGEKVDYTLDSNMVTSVLRELKEEAAIEADNSLRLRGMLLFVFDPADEPKLLEVHVFEANGWKGDP